MSGPLRVRVGRSDTLVTLLAFAHGIACAALWISPVPTLICSAASVALAFSVRRCLHRHAFRTAPDALVELELYEDCTASAYTVDGRWLQFRVIGSSFASQVLTVLNLRAEGTWRMRSVLITRDCIDHHAFRRLRVWLRWHCATRIAAADADPGK
jgi:toxin CptA